MTNSFKIKPEAQIQAECVTWFKNEFRGLRRRLYMVHNDGNKNAITASQDLARGLTKGVLDLNLDIPNGQYSGLRIEMKKPGGSLSPEQKEMIAENEYFGYKSVVVDNLESFQQAILDYLPAHLLPIRYQKAS
ncbi:VRR-NUC domain-containing protein [Adhaeribacter aquaticus]|uniref:VRR-NUC domain-containing protein n=1 Tax=Adhaeribacter aquaticus TaxID=299567 RepID=UPI000559993D|nr:VRR-NUC domain-containing protein [Adhaeribacter aquaticus]